MPRALDIAKIVALWAIGLLAVALVGLAVTVGLAVHSLSAKASATLAGIDKTVGTVNTTVSSLNQTLTAINQPKYGVVAMLNDDLRNLRLTLDNANKAAIEERFFLEKTQPEEVAKLNTVINSSNELIQSTTKNEKVLTDAALGAVQTTNVAVTALIPVENNLAKVTLDLDTLVNDPSNKQTIKNVQTGTAALAATAHEGEEWFHGILHPTWPSRIKSWTIDALTILK